MDYATQCNLGRDHAGQMLRETARTGNLPKMVQTIREIAKEDTGFAVGFLFALSDRAIQINGGA